MKRMVKQAIKELSESILSNGLINPISVREYKNGKYMIVAGERRWQAHKIAGLKTIQAIVRKYKSDGEWMIESLIENVHRENLEPLEKAKYAKQIKDLLNLESNRKVAEKLKLPYRTVNNWFEILPQEKLVKYAKSKGISSRIVLDTKHIKDEELQKKIIDKVYENKINSNRAREYASVAQKSPQEVKKALLDDKISVEQAERISKLKTEQQREKAIHEHKMISMVEKNVERNVKNVESAKEKREKDKRLVQAKNWITSFKYSVTDSYAHLEKTIKILLISTKFIPMMDEKQKETFDTQLDRFLEVLEKAEHLTEQIREKIR